MSRYACMLFACSVRGQTSELAKLSRDQWGHRQDHQTNGKVNRNFYTCVRTCIYLIFAHVFTLYICVGVNYIHELQLNEVPTISNQRTFGEIYKDADPKSRGTKWRLHGSSPSLLWNKNGPEMTCLGTIADLKAHEAIMQTKKAKRTKKANRRAKRFIDKVLSLHTRALA